jgi:hypothetical protein
MPILSFIGYAILFRVFQQFPNASTILVSRKTRARVSLICGGGMGLIYLAGVIQPWPFEQVSISLPGTVMGMLITAVLSIAGGYLGVTVASRVFGLRKSKTTPPEQ